jgi:hypothetical protein
MTLDYEEAERYVSYISSGKKFIYIDSLDDFIIIKFPSNDIKQKAEIIYDKAYKKALSEGLLPIGELENLLEEREIFTGQDKKTLKTLQDKLEAQRVLLSKTLKVRANQDRIKGVIEKLKAEIEGINQKQHSKLIMSAESKAEELKNQYLCWACTEDALGTKMWTTYNDFMKETAFDLKSETLSHFIQLLNGINTKIIRELARNTLWRIRYVTSLKTSEQLFGTPTVDYTTDQLNLIYWSNFYESVYSMMPEHRPSDTVIDDDELLDKYMEEYYKEMSNDASIARSNKATSRGSMSAFDAEEVIITQTHELYHDIEYDKPREAQQVKDRVDLKKRTKSGR